MEKVLILNPCLYTNGGGEKHMGIFCQFLENRYDNIKIDILVYDYNGMKVNDSSYTTVDDINNRFNLSLKKTTVLKLKRKFLGTRLSNFMIDRDIIKISRDYDLFVNWNFLSKQIGKARQNFYSCMFPPKPFASQEKKGIVGLYRRIKDRKFIDGYDKYICISLFTKKWFLEYWPSIKKENIKIIYPPVYSNLEDIRITKKENIIVSVGRFFVDGHNKKQREMLQLFLDDNAKWKGFEYHIVGAVSNKREDIEYLKEIERMAEKSDKVKIHANCSIEELSRIYEKAKIFWHATGAGVDENVNPEKLEHFGITTVEAMRYGVVPVVINMGGQAEIVEEGINGFVWNTFDECAEKTKILIDNEDIWGKISSAARERAKDFSIEKFEHDCEELLKDGR